MAATKTLVVLAVVAIAVVASLILAAAPDWSITLPADAPAGTWTLQAEFEGQVYQHAFTVTAAAATHGHSRHARPAHEPPIQR